MGVFDSIDWSDPHTMAMLGLIQGLGAASAPSRLPTGPGMMFADMVGGAQQGAESALKYRGEQQQVTGGNIDLLSKLQNYNMMAPFLGYPPLSMADAKSGKLDQMTGTSQDQQGGGQTPPSSQAGVMPDTSTGGAPGALDGNSGQPAPTASQGMPAATGPSGGLSSSMRRMMIMQRLGFKPTDYQQAKIYADSLPPGSEHDEAEAAAMHTAGDQFQTMRNGWAYDRVQQKWIHMPSLGEGISASTDEDGNTSASVVPGYLAAAGQTEAVKAGVEATKDKNVASFKNALETGGLGMGTISGGIVGQPANVPPGFAPAVGQAESGGNPNAHNPMPGQTSGGPDGFTDSTWLSTAKKHLPPEMIKGMTDQQILSMKSDPQVSGALTSALAGDNYDSLQGAGVKNPGATELYVAHRFGAGDASKILQAPAGTQISQIVSPQVMAANPDLQGKTVADVYSQARNVMGGVQGATVAPNAGSPIPTASTKPIPGDVVGGVKTTIPPASDQAPIQRGEEYLKARLGDWAKTEDDWADAMPSNQIGEQRAMALLDALKKTESGMWATDKAQINAGLHAIGLPAITSDDPAQVQIALKDNFAATLENIRAFTSRPAAVEVTLGQKNFMNPDLQPAANLKVGAQVVGTLRWERALMNDWATAKKQGWVDPQDYQRAWMKANPIQPFIDGAEKEIGPLKGMPAPKSSALPHVQALVTEDNIKYTAKKRGVSEDQVRKDLKAMGYTIEGSP